MFTSSFHPGRFLRSIYGSEPFLDYCRRRDIPFEQVPGGSMARGDDRRWTASLAQLSVERRHQVEWELSEVNELAGRESLTHLLAAVAGGELPSDSIPGDAALALWFFLHHADAFHAVLFNLEILEVDAWRNTCIAPGQVIDDLPGKAAALATSVREFFQLRTGTGRFCAVDVHRLNEAYCFVANVADRVQLFEGFTEDGEQTLHRLRPAVPVLFVYYPQDGTLLLRPPVQVEEEVCELFRRFGRAVLGVDSGTSGRSHVFALDIFKMPFQPLLDGEDMESIRVKTLHFRYPERHGRRQVKLETLASDEPQAILQLIRAHMSGEGILDQVDVSYAELQVLFKVRGQRKSHVVRLWPNRSNLNQSLLGVRLRACLVRWGIYHAEQP